MDTDATEAFDIPVPPVKGLICQCSCGSFKIYSAIFESVWQGCIGPSERTHYAARHHAYG